jgi:putative membrane protein
MLSLIAQSSAGGLLPENFWANLFASGVFGCVGIVLLLIGYLMFDWITPHLDVQKELRDKNTAVAIVVASLLLGIAYIVAHVVQ